MDPFGLDPHEAAQLQAARKLITVHFSMFLQLAEDVCLTEDFQANRNQLRIARFNQAARTFSVVIIEARAAKGVVAGALNCKSCEG